MAIKTWVLMDPGDPQATPACIALEHAVNAQLDVVCEVAQPNEAHFSMLLQQHDPELVLLAPDELPTRYMLTAVSVMRAGGRPVQIVVNATGYAFYFLQVERRI